MAHRDPYGKSSDGVDPDADTPDLTSYCPPNGLIDTVRTKYAIGIVVHLGKSGELRYGDLKERVGAPGDATMSRRLEQLSDEGLISRHHYDEIPPRVEYSLTPAGRELEVHLGGLLTWSESVEAG